MTIAFTGESRSRIACARIIEVFENHRGEQAHQLILRLLDTDHDGSLSDSVPKGGANDAEIPANVKQAANFYQSSGLLHGLREIHAADPSRTQIIGNFQFDYHAHPVRCDGYPWFARLFERPHIEIECDPNVQVRVETLIRSKLPSASGPLKS